MNKILMATLALLTATSAAMAERNALIQHTDTWNLFSKFDLAASEIDGNFATIGGIKAGGLLNDTLGLGLSIYSVLDSVETESPFLDDIENTDFWYGGFYTEYVFNPEELVYASIDLTLGGGELNISRSAGGEDSSIVFVAEPGANVYVNVTETFMLGAGVRYRLVEGVNSDEIGDSDVSGFAGSIFLRFTTF